MRTRQQRTLGAPYACNHVHASTDDEVCRPAPPQLQLLPAPLLMMILHHYMQIDGRD